MTNTKRPAFQFYPNDWYSDYKLRSVSLSARGLWIDILCIMHQSDKYGYLPRVLAPNPIRIPVSKGVSSIDHVAMISDLIDANPGFCSKLARMVSSSEEEIKESLFELARAHVFSFSCTGRVYSKRMVRDERLRNIRAEAERLGGMAKSATNNRKRVSDTTKSVANEMVDETSMTVFPLVKSMQHDEHDHREKQNKKEVEKPLADGSIVGDQDIAFYTVHGKWPTQRIEVTVTEKGMARLSEKFPGLDVANIVRQMEFYWNKGSGIQKRPKRVYAAIANACRRKAKDLFIEQSIANQNASTDRVINEKANELAMKFNEAAKGVLPTVSLPLSVSRESLLLSAYKLHPDDAYWDDVFEALRTHTLPPNCGFDWLFKSQDNWTKVKERTYEPRIKTLSTSKVNTNPAIGDGATVAKKLGRGCS